MRSVPSLLSMLDDPRAPSAPAIPVVMPWDYIRMRRLSAGLSIEQASRPFWHRPEHREDVERNMRQIEAVGFRVKRLWDMSRAYRLNLTVYRQLCDTPPEQHPPLCLACGWDQWSDQFDRNGDEVTWSSRDPHICTGCDQDNRQRFAGRPANLNLIENTGRRSASAA